MKKVAGKLKLQLAQFRELEAFAQFASDLDPETKKQIDRGRRITEVLKQPQFEPMAVEKQVAVIYAVSNGYFDEVAVEKIKETEVKFLTFMEKSKMSLLEMIAKGEWSDEIESKLKETCAEFNKSNDQ